MRIRWSWWMLAAVPALAGVVSFVLEVGDFRSSGLVLGASVSVVLVAILLLWRRPWRGRDGVSKWLAPVPALLLGLIALLGLSEGLPEFLQARGLFLDVDSQGPRAMVGLDGGLVLAGDDGDGGVVWLSSDGTSWSLIDEPVLDGVLLRDLLVVEDGLLAVAESTEAAEAVVLTSRDGREWQVVGRFGNSAYGTVPWAISQSATTLVAIADIVGNDVEFYQGADPSTWTVSEPTPVFDDGESGSDIACSDSLCVAVGFHDATYRDDVDANFGVAWVSTSGTGYELVDHDFESDQLNAIAWAAPGFLAVGNTPTGKGVAWMSQDGESWTLLTGSYNEMTIDGVTATRDSYMIFGQNAETSELVVWTSKMGDAWNQEIISDELAEGSKIRTIVDNDGTRIAVGIRSDTLDTMIWVSTNNQPWQHNATLHTR